MDLIHSMDISDILNPTPPTSGSTSSGTNSGSAPSGSNLPGAGQSPDEFNALKKGLLDKLYGQYAHNDRTKSRDFSLYSDHFSS